MLKRILTAFVLIGALTALSGCWHQQVVVDSDYDASKVTPDHQSIEVFILGIIGINNTVAVNDVCPNGAGIVENKTFVDGMQLWFVTGGVAAVQVSQKSVYCK